MDNGEHADWLDEASQEVEEVEVDEYDIVSAPNDWNGATIVNFIESGAVKIPSFQRNYVWDVKRASRLIESLLLGLPVPQVFLYEESRNSFLVIDGQQRLLSVFFFAKGRFPKTNSRAAIRSLLNEGKGIEEAALQDDNLFEDFKLRLGKSPAGTPNRFHGKKYATLGEYKATLDLRTIRNVVVKQTRPSGDSSIFEIFSRLNTGGVNLSQQEIRAALFHSQFMSTVLEMNEKPDWRRLLGIPVADSRMRDSEVLLRSFALARGLDRYSGSMASFVNRFCLDARRFDAGQVQAAVGDLTEFLNLTEGLPEDLFRRQGKFSGVLFESFFAAWVRQAKAADSARVLASVTSVKEGSDFADTLQEGSTKSTNVRARVELAGRSLADA
jgi:Protein of unknown function DUF262